MKKILTNTKYIAFVFILLLVTLAFAKQASADTYAYTCNLVGNENGNITTNVYIAPAGPFSTTPTQFNAYGYIKANGCSTDDVSLSVNNNNGSNVLIIAHTVIGRDERIPGAGYNSTSFTTLATPATYNVHYTTTADEIAGPPPPPASCLGYVRFVGQFRHGGVKWLGPATHSSVTATVAIVGNSANGTTTNQPPDYVTFYIPANATQSTMGEFYAVSGFDHGWVDHTDRTWACGDAPQNYLTCFVADTTVALADGETKNIQDIKIGDVLKGETTNNTVLGLHRPNLNGKVYSFNGGRYFVTEEHPFKTIDGWKSINPKKTAIENIGITVTDLNVGDTLITDHGLVKLYSIDGKNEPNNTPLYNFKLNGDHTYYADGYLVHNKQSCDYTNSCGSNKTCIDSGGYRIISPSQSGTCPIQCRYPGLPNQPFCYNNSYGSAMCPTPTGGCN